MLSISPPISPFLAPPAQPPPLVPFISLGSSASTLMHTWFSVSIKLGPQMRETRSFLETALIYLIWLFTVAFIFLSNNFHLFYGCSKSPFTSTAFSCHSSVVGHLRSLHNSTTANTVAINFWPGLNCLYMPFSYRAMPFIQDSLLYSKIIFIYTSWK